MIAFFIAVPIILIFFVIFISIYVVKNIKRSEAEEEKPFVNAEKWEHIRDFSDINSQNDNKINSFGSGFEDDERTIGADISDYIKNDKDNGNEKNNKRDNEAKDINKDIVPNQKVVKNNENLSFPSENNEFINDFKTVSIDTDAFNDVADKTVAMHRPKEEEKVQEKIEVTLKYNDGNSNKLIKMNTSQITIGRGIGNILMLKSDSFASRNHAVLTIKDGKLYLKDLESKNGTYINSNQKVVGEVMIEKSCDVTFADDVVNIDIKYRWLNELFWCGIYKWYWQQQRN